MSTLDGFKVEAEDEENGLHEMILKPDHLPTRKRNRFSSGLAEKIILIVCALLIAGISFQAGLLKGKKSTSQSLIINQPDCPTCEAAASPATPKEEENEVAPLPDNQKCAYVASKNSDKYHLATCQFAERIKPENKLCFGSQEEAKSRGFEPAKCCIK